VLRSYAGVQSKNEAMRGDKGKRFNQKFFIVHYQKLVDFRKFLIVDYVIFLIFCCFFAVIMKILDLRSNNMPNQKLINRPVYLEKLAAFEKTDLIKVVTGVRRCGKSTLFKLFQKELIDKGISKEQITDINLEDAKNNHLLNWKTLHDSIQAKLLNDKTNYIFLDEIQNVTEYERAVNSLNLKDNVDLYITGSNAKMLSGDLATHIAGRYVEISMLPLSFKEYASAIDDKSNLQKHFNDYMSFGAMPGAMPFTQDYERLNDYIRGIYNTIILKDIVARRKISDVYRLESVIKFIFSIIGSETSINNIYKTLKSDGREVQIPTIEGYLEALRESFILYKTDRFDIKGKQLLKTNSKYYIVDTGFRNFLLGHNDSDIGHILENIIYLELIRRGYEVHIGKTNGDKEIDFVARKNGEYSYYQVSQSVLDPKTFDREISALDKIDDHNPKYLLSMDYMNLSRNGIKQINILDWLLE
jgi:predicted AAA+ superfamily ATPase